MGLLNHIEQKSSAEEGIGLLARAQQLSSIEKKDFSSWIRENNFSHAGIFSQVHHIFVLHDAFGFDAESIARSVSSSDFWAGTLTKKNDWNTFTSSSNSLHAFYQLFSESFQQKIKALHFLSLEREDENLILMVADTDSESALPDPKNYIFQSTLFSMIAKDDSEDSGERYAAHLSSGLSRFEAHLLLLSVKLGIDTAIKSIELPENDIRNQVIDTIVKEICMAAETLFQAPNCVCKGINGEIKIVLFCSDDPDEQLIQFHIAQTLQPLLGTSGSAGILLLSAGICHNLKGASAFLIQG